MALDVTRMKANFRQKMKDAFQSQGFDETDPNFNAYAQALCETVIEEIVGHAELTGQYKDGQYNNTTMVNDDVSRDLTGGVK